MLEKYRQNPEISLWTVLLQNMYKNKFYIEVKIVTINREYLDRVTNIRGRTLNIDLKIFILIYRIRDSMS